MIRSLWISKTGLDAQQFQLDVIANNLANVNTTGFKKSRVEFEDLVYQQIKAPGTPTSPEAEAPIGLETANVRSPIGEAIKHLLVSGNIVIQERCAPALRAVLADATQLHQVVMNLCTNAYQAMQETGGRLTVRLAQTQIGYEETLKRIGIKMGPHVHLTVADEGVGMDEAVDRVAQAELGHWRSGWAARTS